MSDLKFLGDFVESDDVFRDRQPLLSRLFPPYCTGSADTVFGIDFFGNKHYDKWWFKATIGLYRDYVLKNIDRVYWWIRYRTVSRYFIVRTGLKPGYYDVDALMFHACFKLLGSFVEKELGIATTDYALKHGYYRGYRVHCLGGTDEKAIDLWLWYRFELKKIEDACEAEWDKFTQEHGYDYIEKIKQEKLLELIEIRETLWT